jgi:uncharacterized repeat protein (TIGR03803 family)
VTDPECKGVVYQMDLAGNVAVVHTFTGPDGGRPYAPVVQAADGRPYGTTAIGGAHDRGIVFAVDPPGGPPPPPPPSQSPSPEPTAPPEPPPPSVPPVISNLTLSPSTVQGGWESSGEVTLSGAAPSGGAVISLSASGGWAWTPSSVTVLEGTSIATFRITTKLIKRTKVARITAFYNDSSAAAELMITP